MHDANHNSDDDDDDDDDDEDEWDEWDEFEGISTSSAAAGSGMTKQANSWQQGTLTTQHATRNTHRNTTQHSTWALGI